MCIRDRSKEVGDFTGLIYPNPEDTYKCTVIKAFPNNLSTEKNVLGYATESLDKIISEDILEPTKYLYNAINGKSVVSKVSFYCR